MKRKLIRIERTLNIYTKANELIQEISIDIPFDTIIDIVSPKDDDPLLYDGYILDEEQLSQFNKVLKQKIEIDSNRYFYVLECTGIYE